MRSPGKPSQLCSSVLRRLGAIEKSLDRPALPGLWGERSRAPVGGPKLGGQAESLRLPGPELLGTSRGETHLCSGFVPGRGRACRQKGESLRGWA